MIFDSDIFIWFLRREQQAATWVAADEERAISIITLMEALQGARSKVDMATILDLFRRTNFRVLPLSESIGHTAAALVEEHTLSTGIQLADALIASTALEADEVLVTANIKHFRGIRRLKLKTFRPALR